MITVATILTRASKLLFDEEFVRWPMSELAGWVDEAISTIVKVYPSASTEELEIALVRGTEQALPDDQRIVALIDIPQNVDGPAILVTRKLDLDFSSPNWHQSQYVRYRPVVRQFCFAPGRPKVFYVYPGNNGVGQVRAVVSKLPQPIAERISGPDTSIVSYEIEPGIGDEYQDVLLDYVLYRANLKEDLAAAPARATLHYQAFTTSLGIQVRTEAAIAQRAGAA